MIETPTNPRRSWFRFSLRSLFVVVTVFAVWLGWELNFIRERRQFLQRTAESNRHYIVAHREIMITPYKPAFDQPATIPIWRRWLGDECEGWILLPDNASAVDYEKAKKLFPEAQVIWSGQQPTHS